MKVVPPKEVSKTTSKILLPLEDDTDDQILTKSNSVSFDLRTVPAQADSPTYKSLARVLEGTESARTILKWRADVAKVCRGLHVTTYDTKGPVCETMMRTGPLSLFRNSLRAEAQAAFELAIAAAPQRNPANPLNNDQVGIRNAGLNPHRHVDHIDIALNFVVQQLLPHKVLARVKRNLRREMRKPSGMKVRAYYQALLRINVEEVPALPPFQATQGLSDDELLDIILFGTPKSWQKEMEKQGYDPMGQPLNEVVDFLENIESAEDFENGKSEEKKKKSSSKTKSKSSSSNGELYCMLHGKGNHATEDCVKLKAEAKRLKSTSSSGKKSSDKKSDKSWGQKATNATAKAKSDLAAIVKRQVKMTLKDLKASDKKRKSSGDDSSLEANVADLDAFNYARQMENLSIDSDTDTEVEV